MNEAVSGVERMATGYYAQIQAIQNAVPPAHAFACRFGGRGQASIRPPAAKGAASGVKFYQEWPKVASGKGEVILKK